MTSQAIAIVADLKLTDLPRVATEWPGQGGSFIGLMRGQDGAADYLLMLGPKHNSELDWQKAMEWAAGLEVDGHKDFTLPTRSEQAVLFGNARDQFKRDGYWSCEQHAEYAGYAWLQFVSDGGQFSLHEDYEWRARAVRRLIIQ